MNTVTEAITAATKRQAATFAYITYTRKKDGEKARYFLVLNADTEALYRKDIETLNQMIPNLSGLDLQAATSILESLKESLTLGINHNTAYTHSPERGDTYEYVEGLKGVRIHKENGTVYFNGLLQRKEVIISGTPRKPVNSAPLTIAKHRIDKQLKRGSFRQFIFKRLTKIAVNGNTLEIEGES